MSFTIQRVACLALSAGLASGWPAGWVRGYSIDLPVVSEASASFSFVFLLCSSFPARWLRSALYVFQLFGLEKVAS